MRLAWVVSLGWTGRGLSNSNDAQDKKLLEVSRVENVLNSKHDERG